MERVIGDYAGFASAQSAIRGLEKRGISLQNMLIVDRELQVGGRLRLQKSSSHPVQRFLVVMRGEAPALAAAEELLSQLSIRRGA